MKIVGECRRYDFTEKFSYHIDKGNNLATQYPTGISGWIWMGNSMWIVCQLQFVSWERQGREKRRQGKSILIASLPFSYWEILRKWWSLMGGIPFGRRRTSRVSLQSIHQLEREVRKKGIGRNLRYLNWCSFVSRVRRGKEKWKRSFELWLEDPSKSLRIGEAPDSNLSISHALSYSLTGER